MNSLKQPKFGPMVTALVLLFSFLLFPSSYLKGLVPNQKLIQAAASSNVDRFKNVFLEQAALDRNQKFLPLVGSSTVGIFSRYHPSNYFLPNQFTPYLIGEPGVTNNLHVLNFSALRGSLSHKKLVIMLDTSEFEAPAGINDQGFTKYYSPLNGYSFLFNNEISSVNKKLVATHLLKYTAIKSDHLMITMINGIVHHDLKSNLLAVLFRPIAYLKMRLLEKLDFIKAFLIMKEVSSYKHATVSRGVSWAELQSQAVKEAQQQSSNNPYGIENGIFDSSIQKQLALQKDSWHPNNHYLNSESYDDFRAVLDILKSEHADPLFVLIPKKATWSDYRGFTKSYRDSLYDKIVNEVKSYGFQVKDYRSREYDPYFLRDPWHLGWTGWVTLDQDLTQYESR